MTQLKLQPSMLHEQVFLPDKKMIIELVTPLSLEWIDINSCNVINWEWISILNLDFYSDKPNKKSFYGSKFNETDCSYDNLDKKGLIDRRYDGIGIRSYGSYYEWNIFSPPFSLFRPKCDFFCVKDPNIRL